MLLQHVSIAHLKAGVSQVVFARLVLKRAVVGLDRWVCRQRVILCRSAQGRLQLLIWTCGATDYPNEAKAIQRDGNRWESTRHRWTSLTRSQKQLCTDVAELEVRWKKKALKLSLKLSCLGKFPHQSLSLFGLFSGSSGYTCLFISQTLSCLTNSVCVASRLNTKKFGLETTADGLTQPGWSGATRATTRCV